MNAERPRDSALRRGESADLQSAATRECPKCPLARRPDAPRCGLKIRAPICGVILSLSLFSVALCAVELAPSDAGYQVKTITLPGEMRTRQGPVNYRPGGQPEVAAHIPQGLGYGDGLRTLEHATAAVQLTDLSSVKMKEFTRLEIVWRAVDTNAPTLFLHAGEIYVSSRGGPVAVPIITPKSTNIAQGTEFLVRFDPGTERTEVTMFDGEVEVQNDTDSVKVTGGRSAYAEPGKPPRLVATIQATNLVQWWLYYPGVLDPEELGLAKADETLLAESLRAFRRGHLPDALAQYPGYPALLDPTSDAQRIYQAACVLAVGSVDRAEALLSQVQADLPTASALRTMIWAVSDNRLNGQPTRSPPEQAAPGSLTDAATASELLALSYHHQSQRHLDRALEAARAAISRSPGFGSGWARVAELEFSFGRIRAAREAVNHALQFSPDNAQAHALRGFLSAAENRLKEARESFDRAIALDPLLGNGWLGRGLCQIRAGRVEEGRRDLEMTAILEPRRSLIRSYAGKAFGDAGNAHLALKEIAYAKQLDPNDPTPWLYSALEKWQEYRANEAIADLERSILLNTNRAVFRSELLLDQDRAVRSASLAKVYQSAGLDEVALAEAAKAVAYDYANHSAHLFLAESFNALRDATRFNLRYETVWFNELLLANILAPVGAGVLSQNISQQEYAHLLEKDGLGLLSSTEVRSDGQVRQIASQYGTFGSTSYSLDLDYQHNDGVRPNNDLDRLEWYSQIKLQLSPRDSLFLLTKYMDYESGDNYQHYDPAWTSPTLRIEETQAPIILAALHREWQPGIVTSLLAGWLDDGFKAQTHGVDRTRVLDLRTEDGALFDVVGRDFRDTRFESDFAAWVGEVNQIVRGERATLVAGTRLQNGRLEASSVLDGQTTSRFSPPIRTDLDESSTRVGAYGYITYEVLSGLRPTVGLAYDHLEYPDGFRSVPVSPGSGAADCLLPKAAVTWEALPTLTFRGLYAQTLGGVTFEDSVRLEPTQLAGFSQAFRSVISEAEAASVIAPRNEVGNVALDVQVGPRTFATVQAQWLRSRVEQQLGVFRGEHGATAEPSSTQERLGYQERSLVASVNQLIGDEWSLGASYRVTDSALDWDYPEIPNGTPLAGNLGPGNLSRTEAALLQEVLLRLGFTHHSGVFARAEYRWLGQDNEGYGYPNAWNAESRPGDSVFQLDLYVGLRFARRRGEVVLGCLNVTDEDYRLNSLTPFFELPRERVWAGQVRLSF